MSDIRTIFDEVLNDQPPTRITRDLAIGAGRRARRRRNGLAMAGAAAAVAALALAVGALPRPWLSTVSGAQVVAAPATAGQTATQPTTPSPTGGPEQVAARLTGVVQAAAARVRPDAQFLADPGFREGAQPGPLEIMPPNPPEVHWYEGFATVVDSKGSGTLWVDFYPAGTSTITGPCAGFTARSTSCVPRTGPHGEPIAVTSSGKTDGTQFLEVAVFLADGTVVIVGAANYTSSGGVGTSPTPPFTVDELIDLATSSGMTLAA